MTDIEISCSDYFFSGLDQSFDLFLIVGVKVEFVAEHLRSIRSFSSIWEIDIEKDEI